MDTSVYGLCEQQYSLAYKRRVELLDVKPVWECPLTMVLDDVF